MENKKCSKKLYSIKETYWIFYKGIRTMKYMIKAKKNGEMKDEFIERIMLTVTEVNGCALCSYAHTKMALESGMSNGEIQNMLSGVMEDVPEAELAAVLFAQHYADTRGNPSKEAWKRIIKTYGRSKAYGILGAIRVIMIGNVTGIPIGTFISRLKGKTDRIDKRSNIFYEISILIISILFIPISLLHALFSDLLKISII